MPLQPLLDGMWRIEAATCLMWALGLVPEIPPYDRQADPEDLLSRIPYDNPLEFARIAQLRPAEEIDRAREIAEL